MPSKVVKQWLSNRHELPTSLVLGDEDVKMYIPESKTEQKVLYFSRQRRTRGGEKKQRERTGEKTK